MQEGIAWDLFEVWAGSRFVLTSASVVLMRALKDRGKGWRRWERVCMMRGRRDLRKGAIRFRFPEDQIPLREEGRLDLLWMYSMTWPKVVGPGEAGVFAAMDGMAPTTVCDSDLSKVALVLA